MRLGFCGWKWFGCENTRVSKLIKEWININLI